MTKPPPSTPHSDIDGVHRDERPNVETANAVGEDSGDLQKASENDMARPDFAPEGDSLDERSK